MYMDDKIKLKRFKHLLIVHLVQAVHKRLFFKKMQYSTINAKLKNSVENEKA